MYILFPIPSNRWRVCRQKHKLMIRLYLFSTQAARLTLEAQAALQKHLLPCRPSYYLASSEAFQDMGTKSCQDHADLNSQTIQDPTGGSLFPNTPESATSASSPWPFSAGQAQHMKVSVQTCTRHLFSTFLMNCLHEGTDAFHFCKRLSTQAPKVRSPTDALQLTSCFFTVVSWNKLKRVSL